MSNSSKFNKDKCPVCGNLIPDDSKFYPFCSQRCKQVDLGIWFTGGYSIPAVEPPDDLDTLTNILEDG